jgi:glyoxylase-like metal-dependent hydrolase (beta-lactamase superfamily II)
MRLIITLWLGVLLPTTATAQRPVDDDAIFYFENADVLHTGDVFVLYGYPFIDLSSGGSIAGMIRGVDRILAIAGPGTLIIPGHGAVANRARVAGFRDLLAGSRDRVQKLISEGKTLPEIIAAKPLADLDDDWGKGFVKADQFVTTIFNSEQGGS